MVCRVSELQFSLFINLRKQTRSAARSVCPHDASKQVMRCALKQGQLDKVRGEFRVVSGRFAFWKTHRRRNRFAAPLRHQTETHSRLSTPQNPLNTPQNLHRYDSSLEMGRKLQPSTLNRTLGTHVDVILDLTSATID